MRLVTPAAAVRAAPSLGAEQLDQLLFGEIFEVLEEEDGFAWGQAAATAMWAGRGRRRSRRRDLARRPTGVGAAHLRLRWRRDQVALARPFSLERPGRRVETDEGRARAWRERGWMAAAHLRRIGVAFETDPAAVAERFLGAPYLWGGRDSLGLDCSGLVQQALYACGRACPRDSDQQAALGRAGRPRRRSGAATWCSGAATSASCSTASACSTPTATTWRSPSSRWTRP